MRVLFRFLIDYWYVPLIAIMALGGLVLVLVLRAAGGGDAFDPIGWFQQELRVIGAGREAREAKISAGEDLALQHVQAKYAERRAKLDAKAEARVKELEGDPVALARALERASRG